MTPLGEALIRRIGATGPITVADYIAECLLHPAYGYYATRDPFGRAGDFTTAPEISQMFGELLGLALAQSWMDQGAPAYFTLAELGPGRGTLMADVLRATARVPGFHAAANLWLIEASPTLKEAQRETLPVTPQWADDASALPDAPLFLLANEFFDALPIRQFTRTEAGWAEHMIGSDGTTLQIGLAPASPRDDLAHFETTVKPGEIVELRPAAAPVMTEIAQRLQKRPGAAIIIDYGSAQSRGDTLQAVKAHAFADPLAEPGLADLTAHVDFGALVAAAPGCKSSLLTPQGVLLERLGITNRAQALARNLTGDALNAHIAAHRRLTHPDEMGTLFQALALVPDSAPLPPGFDT